MTAELVIRQQVKLMINRFEIERDGSMVGFIEQKRMKLKEEITVYSDATKTSTVATMKADRALDVAAVNRITAADGTPLGAIRKEFGKSLLRSTLTLLGPDDEPVGTAAERSQGVAIARRVSDFLPYGEWIPWQFHFDVTAPDGAALATIDRKRKLRDEYHVSFDEDRLDWRVAALLGIAVDVFLGR